MRPSVYLDYNASAPLVPEARKAMIAALDIDGNPASVHRQGRATKALIQKARRQVAALVNAKPEHVVFTSGATEAAMTLLTPHYTMGRSPLRVSHLYISASDHPCLLTGGQFAADHVTQLPVTSDGLADVNALDEALSRHNKSDGLALVGIHHVNNETGVIQPIGDIATVCKKHGAIFVVDAVQAAGRLPIDITAGHADYIILSAHKLGGPKGAGAFVAASDLMMPMPLISGGGQERGHRGGTEASVALAGFGAAAQAAAMRVAQFETLAPKRDRLISALKQISNRVIIYGENAPRVGNTVYVGVADKKAETIQIALDLAGYAVSSGSACSSGKVGKSHVLAAMGVESDEGAIRISFGPDVLDDDLTKFAAEFERIIVR